MGTLTRDYMDGELLFYHQDIRVHLICNTHLTTRFHSMDWIQLHSHHTQATRETRLISLTRPINHNTIPRLIQVQRIRKLKRQIKRRNKWMWFIPCIRHLNRRWNTLILGQGLKFISLMYLISLRMLHIVIKLMLLSLHQFHYQLTTTLTYLRKRHPERA